jgi:hypothetical protein
VTTIVTDQELPRLQDIAEELGLALVTTGEQEQGLGLLPLQQQVDTDSAEGQATDLAALKRGLEDIFKLL